ncbi:hypothetical protein AB0D38_07300 [Streptomyces sp. NPDC048279]|uniref:hypothetical protein n=1 Tax=Streptomyces sp. NPDC048279 TaxID=3154714 RepID=UPI00342F4A3F
MIGSEAARRDECRSSIVSALAAFQQNLAIAADVFADRLAMLAHEGIAEKRSHPEPGGCTCYSHHLTAPAGNDLRLVISAFQQRGDEHRARPAKPQLSPALG